MRTFLLPLFLLLAAGRLAAADDFRLPLDTINQTLNCIGIDTSDVGFRTDWVDLDSFRLPVVDRFTVRPLGLPAFVKERADSLLAPELTISEQYRGLRKLLGGDDATNPGNLTWSASVGNYFADFQARRRGCDSLGYYVEATLRAMAGYRQDLSRWNSEEQRMLVDTFKLFLREEEKDVERPLEELDSLQKLQEAVALRFKALSERVNPRPLAWYGGEVVAAYQALADWLERTPDLAERLRRCDLLTQYRDVKTPLGRVAVRGSDNDRYEGFYDLIIDLGGDDEYYLSRSEDMHSQIVIDLGGNDKNFGQSDHTLGAGFFSVGILDDWGGNDLYVGGKYSLGCGMFGVGILRDRAGDDTYSGDLLTQGAAAFGVGLLIDDAGRDSYNAALYAQGFGFIMGAGVLIDKAGNDRYAAGWKYGDILRYEDHYVSLSQGFGYGYRPYFSGGIGLLVDGAGNDQYSADIFGQGASYWYAIGGLLDYGGNDNYIGYQYTQGAATHMCLATLVDLAGEDLYSSKGVSQGCGHDIAFALLLDCSGNDQYSATDLSQAAGSANGIGMLIDLRGNDGHIARVRTNTHGYGNPRREFGSIGLFLDLEGVDDYRGYGTDNSYWVTESKWGIGADLNSEVRQ